MQDSASFWTDIKNLEDQLAKSPDSFCFARLADVYLKVGLVDDALHVARKGVVKHPGYLSGQRVLALACHAKGLNDEALTALRRVADAFPEDVASQKLLGRLCSESGDTAAAGRAFRTVLEFAPDDVECRLELESLERLSGTAYEADADDESIIEDLELLDDEMTVPEEDDSAFEEEVSVQEEVSPEPEELFLDTAPEPVSAPAPHHDPLSTGTLAELYVSQGFIHKALEIYRAILADNPADLVTAGRIAELEVLDSSATETGPEDDVFVMEEEKEEETLADTPPESVLPGPEPAPFEAAVTTGAAEISFDYSEPVVPEAVSLALPVQGAADNALSTLDRWLENIRRIRSCR